MRPPKKYDVAILQVHSWISSWHFQIKYLMFYYINRACQVVRIFRFRPEIREYVCHVKIRGEKNHLHCLYINFYFYCDYRIWGIQCSRESVVLKNKKLPEHRAGSLASSLDSITTEHYFVLQLWVAGQQPSNMTWLVSHLYRWLSWTMPSSQAMRTLGKTRQNLIVIGQCSDWRESWRMNERKHVSCP